MRESKPMLNIMTKSSKIKTFTMAKAEWKITLDFMNLTNCLKILLILYNFIVY